MRIKLISIFFIFYNVLWGQSRNTSDWLDYGSNHISKWIQVAPGKMGPNALPVPDMDYALIGNQSSVAAGTHLNVLKGETSINSYLDFYWAVAPGKVAVKIWGFPSETFRINNQIRDERQIYYDDGGWITSGGDLWISTFILLLNNHQKLPDLVINYSMKTTTGSILHARYTDGPAHYFYAAAGKSISPKNGFPDEIRIAVMGGIYIWQTNKVEMAQDEGPLFESGFMLRHQCFSLFNEVGGYNGYGAYGYMGVADYNFPIIYRARLLREGKNIDCKFEYKSGWNDYNYTTIKFELVYNFSL